MTGSLSSPPGLPQYQEALTELKDCTDPKLHYARGDSEPDMQNPCGRLKRIQRSTIIGDWRTLRPLAPVM